MSDMEGRRWVRLDPFPEAQQPRTKTGRRLFTDSEPMDMLESDGVTWADVLAIEAEAAAESGRLREALDKIDRYADERGDVHLAALVGAARDLL